MRNRQQNIAMILGAVICLAIIVFTAAFVAAELARIATPENIGEAAGRIAKSFNETVESQP